MPFPRPGFWHNPVRWYLLGGTGLLGLSVWLPWFTAARTARVEMRAEHVGELLLEAVANQPLGLDAAAVEHVWARFQALALAHDAFLGDLERVEPPLPDTLLTLRSKHYAFHLAATPPEAGAPVGRDTVPALEVMAWPLEVVGPAHSVYLYAENAPRAYTRNLASGYHGLDNDRPPPGVGQRRVTGNFFDRARSYRAASDERWILY